MGGDAYGVVTISAPALGPNPWRTQSGVSLTSLDAQIAPVDGAREVRPNEKPEADGGGRAATLRAELAPLNTTSKWWVTPVLPQLVLGPVVGQVTETSAVIMLEIDRAATCGLTLRDVLTGEVIQARCAAPAYRPVVLRLEPLRPAHRCVAELE